MQLDSAKITALARIAHASIREFSLVTGSDATAPWDEASQSIKDSAIAGITRLVENLDTTPEELHEEWMKERIADGWTYGETKDEAAKTHPCLVPYKDLSPADRFKDTLFMSVLLAYLDFLDQADSSASAEEDLPGDEFEVLNQLFNSGPLADGDVVSKTGRDELVSKGLVFRHDGFQSLTQRGLTKALELGMDSRKYADRFK